MHRIDLLRRLLLLAILIPILGCDSADERLASHAQHSTAQQARQNEAIAEQSRTMASQIQEVASAAHELVQQDALARRELLESQQQLQEHIHEERSVVD